MSAETFAKGLVDGMWQGIAPTKVRKGDRK